MIFNIPFSLLALAIGAFGIGLTEFVIMGLLPEVATAMNVSIPEAGYYISSYALGVVIGAPTLTILGRKLPPKRMLVLLMIVFTIFNGLSALAPNSLSLLILRFLSGLPHGAFFGVGAVVAGKLSSPGKAAASFAIVISGLTICNIIGVPIATYIGQTAGWRFSFGLVALVGLLAIFSIMICVPNVEQEPSKELSHEFVIFKKTSLWYIIAVMSIGFGAFFAWFSYITPILTNITGFSQSTIPYLLSLAGLGMTFGNWLGGKMGDNLSPTKATAYLLTSMIVVLLLNTLFASYTVPMYILTFITGANAMALVGPLQLLLINTAKESPFLGASLGQGAFNIGNSLGAFLGGIPLAAGLSLKSPWLTGAILALLGLALTIKLKSILKNKEDKSILLETKEA